MRELGLHQTVSEPTRGNNILDLFFTNIPSLIKKSSVISGVSDHEAVTVEGKLHLYHQKQPKHKIFLWSKANVNKIKDEARKFASNFLNNSRDKDVNAMWLSFQTNLISILENSVPTKLTFPQILPTMDYYPN